jgi:hypothetical protein
MQAAAVPDWQRCENVRPRPRSAATNAWLLRVFSLYPPLHQLLQKIPCPVAEDFGRAKLDNDCIHQRALCGCGDSLTPQYPKNKSESFSVLLLLFAISPQIRSYCIFIVVHAL